MAVTSVAAFIKVGNTWFNANEIRQINLIGDNTGNAYVIYGGGGHLKMNFGASDSAAVTAINTLLGGPVDATTNLIGYVN